MNLELEQRSGWPAELRVLLDRFPRSTWRTSPSGMALFWLEIHDGFRREAEAVRANGEAYRDGRVPPDRFAAAAVPRLWSLVAHLDGHHRIEDVHYFPAFRKADARLAPGIDALERDHHKLREYVTACIAAAGNLDEALRVNGDSPRADAPRRAADRLVAAAELLMRRLLRHLDDEEDLLVPLMLNRQRSVSSAETRR